MHSPIDDLSVAEHLVLATEVYERMVTDGIRDIPQFPTPPNLQFSGVTILTELHERLFGPHTSTMLAIAQSQYDHLEATITVFGHAIHIRADDRGKHSTLCDVVLERNPDDPEQFVQEVFTLNLAQSVEYRLNRLGEKLLIVLPSDTWKTTIHPLITAYYAWWLCKTDPEAQNYAYRDLLIKVIHGDWKPFLQAVKGVLNRLRRTALFSLEADFDSASDTISLIINDHRVHMQCYADELGPTIIMWRKDTPDSYHSWVLGSPGSINQQTAQFLIAVHILGVTTR